jgi:hypothetical protein
MKDGLLCSACVHAAAVKAAQLTQVSGASPRRGVLITAGVLLAGIAVVVWLAVLFRGSAFRTAQSFGRPAPRQSANELPASHADEAATHEHPPTVDVSDEREPSLRAPNAPP